MTRIYERIVSSAVATSPVEKKVNVGENADSMNEYRFRYIIPYAVNSLIKHTRRSIDTFQARLLARWWGIRLGKAAVFYGVPIFRKHPTGRITIGEHSIFRSAEWSNTIGLNRRCIISVSRDANIMIGDYCGFSATAIASVLSIEIGNRVICGANCTITDTDYHPLDPIARMRSEPAKTEPVVIEDDVWLGMNVIVLKGCRIGKGTVVASGSIVTHSLPENVLAGGIPARVLKEL
jgi:acetyltransferase-like isoleucine patch superfamily enzyme